MSSEPEMETTVEEPGSAGPTRRTPAPGSRRPRKTSRAVGQKWVRRVHSWLSMTALLVILFFALTGITLNHPTWFGASDAHERTVTGVLPSSAVSEGRADPLAISEYLRDSRGVTGQVTDHTESAKGGTIAYEGPGTEASVEYTDATGSYKLKKTSYGFVGTLNDLHTARSTGSSFHWVIDASGGFLALVAVTGLTLQLYIRRTRRVGLVLVGIGAASGIALMLVNR